MNNLVLHHQENEHIRTYSISDFYQLLALSLQIPTTELAEAFITGSYQEDVLSILEELNSSIDEQSKIKRLFHELKNHLKERDSLLQEMRIEHTRLFYDPLNPALDIYETTFRKTTKDKKEKPLLFVSEQAIAVEQCYREAGLTLKTNDPADHLVTELEFMMALHGRKAVSTLEHDKESLEKITLQIANFKEKHLGKWAIEFFGKLEEESIHPVYKAIGQIGRTGLARIL